MGRKLAQYPEDFFSRDDSVIFDEFDWFVTAHRWTSAVAGTGTVTKADGGTNIRLFSTADNDAAVLATTTECFKFTAGKSMCAEAQVTFTDPNTDDASVGFGWADALAATTLADTTGAVAATDACLIFKVNGSNVWGFHTEINGVAQTSVSDTPAGGGLNQTLRIEVQPRGQGSSVLEATPLVNGVPLKTAAGAPIVHTITLGTATDMDFGWILKGHHADDCILLSDYVFARQVR
jgi:hypothetical protein